jgi:hypothetical protein
MKEEYENLLLLLEKEETKTLVKAIFPLWISN